MTYAAVVPEETDLLCEGCGYTLNGLPTSGNCPECGKPIPESMGEHRHLSPFEIEPSLKSFVSTTRSVLFHPTEFYRTPLVRAHTDEARRFSQIHLTIATVLFALTTVGHAQFVFEVFAIDSRWVIVLAVIGTPLILVLMLLLTKLATWLSAIEARYWGMRLPYQVVARGLAFHTAHYLPVGLLAAGVVWGYRLMLIQQWTNHASDWKYLYALSVTVLLAAGYLFRTYWVGMRNMMHANR
jgi:hypothetical protein